MMACFLIQIFLRTAVQLAALLEAHLRGPPGGGREGGAQRWGNVTLDLVSLTKLNLMSRPSHCPAFDHALWAVKHRPGNVVKSDPLLWRERLSHLTFILSLRLWPLLFTIEIKSECKNSYVPIAPDAVVRTVILEAKKHTEPERIPLVLIHGFGAGFLQFYKNLDHLHSKRKVLALDLPGFGQSTRILFTPEAEKAEMEFVDSIERWREGVGVEKFILLGHSLGGYLACAYAMSYPSRVRHLILVDPWGLPAPPTKEEIKQKYPPWAGVLFSAVSNLNPFTPIRVAGPWGPDLVKRMRPDLLKTFGDSFMNYVYHCNAQKPTWVLQTQ